MKKSVWMIVPFLLVACASKESKSPSVEAAKTAPPVAEQKVEEKKPEPILEAKPETTVKAPAKKPAKKK